jgi:putative Mg2+ transporter-C (MgtC) family protein
MLLPLFDNLYEIMPSYLVGMLAVVAAAICGAAIGWDRERLRKPAGLTTMALICSGTAIYTQASLLLISDQGDPARIAAQVVTGIGFLGAGAILRERGEVTGLTTAATIWSVAAVGIVMGSGYIAAGLGLTALILAVLTGLKEVESSLMGRCAMGSVGITFDSDGGKTELALRQVLDQYRMADSACLFEVREGSHTLTVRYCHVHKHHRRFVGDLAAHPAVLAVHQLHTNEHHSHEALS